MAKNLPPYPKTIRILGRNFGRTFGRQKIRTFVRTFGCQIMT